MTTSGDVYDKLKQEINKMPIPYSETKSGVELRLLTHLFTPAEAEIALNLNIMPETLDRIHKRVHKSGIAISREELEDVLDTLVKKGAIMGAQSKRKGKLYSLVQLAIGMFEFQVDRLTRDFVEDFEQYVKEQFHKDVMSTKTKQMRTVPVSQSVTPDLRVESYNDIRAYVHNLKDDIAVINCVCRQSADIIGNPCRHSDIRETCLMLSGVARFSVARGIGRMITKEEALAILGRAEDAGFILQPENAQEPKFICCCCIDCCHELKILKMHPKPADLFISNYYATIDPSLCKGCEMCIDRCGMGAISMEDNVAVINHDRCIGCGVCGAVCVNDAHRMHKKDTPHIPPKTHNDMYKKIMIERFGLVNTLRTVSRVLTGRKA
jgi:Pyruvate/2-oxoacid:ferredoxin oxidoreductase delta subunit